MDAGLKRELEDKVYAGERLRRADGIALYDSDDLAWLGRLAHHRRTELNGDRVLFTVSRHLRLTGGYATGIEEAVRAATELRGEGLTELRLVGDPDPSLPWRYYPEVLRELRAALPDVQLTAFGAAEIQRFEKLAGRPADELLDELLDAGLASLTGGGAEIFDDAHWADWSRIHRLAHAKGLRTPSTMRYGDVEEPRHRVDHVLRLRELQDETGGFTTFVPLRHQHDSETRDRAPGRTTTGAPTDSLRTSAVSRLLFDNVPHVGCSWMLHGASVAQLALQFGIDDLDGSVVDDQITDDAGDAPAALHRADLVQLIWDGGFRPVERDARYTAVREYDPAPSLAERRAEPQRVWA
jgi:aminodeoxyfutalosine synthase